MKKKKKKEEKKKKKVGQTDDLYSHVIYTLLYLGKEGYFFD